MFEKEEFIKELINIHKNNGIIDKSQFTFELEEKKSDENFEVSSEMSSMASTDKSHVTPIPSPKKKRTSLRQKGEIEKKNLSLTAEVKKMCAKSPFKEKKK